MILIDLLFCLADGPPEDHTAINNTRSSTPPPPHPPPTTPSDVRGRDVFLVLAHYPDYQHRGSPSTTSESRTVRPVSSKTEKAPCVRGTDVLMDTTRWLHRLTFELERIRTQHRVTASSKKASVEYFNLFYFNRSRRLSLHLCISVEKVPANLIRLVFWMATKSSTVLNTVNVCLRDILKKNNARKQVLNTKLVCCDLCIIKEIFENKY